MDLQPKSFLGALRPFSFVVIILSVGLALVWVANQQGWSWQMLWVWLAAALIQAGVNLINDYGDRQQLGLLPDSPARQRKLASVRQHLYAGEVALLLAVLLGLYLAWYSGWSLLWLGALGLLGCWGYTQEPINYKRRGWGAVLAGLMMGSLMSWGSVKALTGQWQAGVWWWSAPLALLIGWLLLANEIRDLEQDRQRHLYTLSVRLGLVRARRWYLGLPWLVVMLMLLLLLGSLPLWGWFLAAAWLGGNVYWHQHQSRIWLMAAPGQRQGLMPLSGRLLALLGGSYLLILLNIELN